jgi:tetratricopeptide (TPR) repeat protein
MAVPAKGANPPSYEEALDLIHAFSGSGDELQRALQLADALSKSHPDSGYAQTLLAEALSTWRLTQKGEPAELRDQIIKLSDEALRLNPLLAQAHVAKARALVRASRYGQAEGAIDAALKLDPNLSGAMFLRAEIFRRIGNVTQGDVWYRRFIDSTSSRSRKSNGYYWLGKMYQDAAWDNPAERKVLTAKARDSYERMLELAPDGAWANVNFAIFLNDHAADFDGAERYALKALSKMEFPMARYHLAAARYQKLWARASNMDSATLDQAVSQVFSSTTVSLKDAIAFPAFSSVVRGRLQGLQARILGSVPGGASLARGQLQEIHLLTIS